MTSASQLLASLASRGVVLQADGDRLHIEAPTGVLSGSDRRALKELKPDLVALLSGAMSDHRWSTPASPDGEPPATFAVANNPGTSSDYDVPPALLECPDRVFDEYWRCWRRGVLIEPTRGTMPAYRTLQDRLHHNGVLHQLSGMTEGTVATFERT